MEKDSESWFWPFLIVLFFFWNLVIAFGFWGGIPEGCFTKIEKWQKQIEEQEGKIAYFQAERVKLQEKIEILRTQVNQLKFNDR